jgi:hypothetical protein
VGLIARGIVTGATELNLKLYRQATNKIVGISDAAAAFLRGFFRARTLGGHLSAGQLIHPT